MVEFVGTITSNLPRDIPGKTTKRIFGNDKQFVIILIFSFCGIFWIYLFFVFVNFSSGMEMDYSFNIL